MSTFFDKEHFSDFIDGEAEIISILSTDNDQTEMDNVPEYLPILSLRNTVLFPGVIIPITVGRAKSKQLVNEVYKDKKWLAAVAQNDINVEEPGFNDLFKVGTIAKILKVLEMPDGNSTVIIQGRQRCMLNEIVAEEPYLVGAVSKMNNAVGMSEDENYTALMESLRDLSLQIIQKSSNIPNEAAFAIKNIDDDVQLINFICSNLNNHLTRKQELLELDSMSLRAEEVLGDLSVELQMVELKNHIQRKVKSDLDKQQRDFLLNQQLKTIQEELGGDSSDMEIDELRKRAEFTYWGRDVKKIFEKELNKLQRMNPSSMEYSTQMNYLETLLDLPWGIFTKDNFNLQRAQKILDKDHFGLDQVKDRIIEYLAVLKLKGNMKSPIICLVGPPGVGKTSLGKSIAKALGRKYVRMSLGGLRDESEIRGHRKTYVGAMPGRIMQNLKKVESSNPVFVLDEIDKVIGTNVNGDPSAALLEVLDPEQNSTFYDNFLEVEYDLSHVMFVATANTMSTIHPALRDRMEVIDVSGYLLEEKVQIAKRHLVPKQVRAHGLTLKRISFSDEILEKIIEDYTRESGVRLLEKTIARIVRRRAKSVVLEEKVRKKISTDDLKTILGAPRFQRDKELEHKQVGVVTGLAWTSVGGEILFIEVALSQGTGKLTLTGNLGDVMKESASLALEHLKSKSEQLGIDVRIFNNWNIHIHIPEGATPKDGPSAGITMFTALTSALTQRKVKSRIAMTGEITLRGKVLPVGGIKEKILAAKRAKITDIILSVENRKDIEEIKQDYIEGLNFHFVENTLEVIEKALLDEQIDNPKQLLVSK